MGRAKIQIKRIEDNTNRQVTFCKRRTGLMKKASEIAVLCDADVAVVVVSSYGRVHSYASSKYMEHVLQNARDKLRCGGGGGNIATPPPQLLSNNMSSTQEMQTNREPDQLELGLARNELENLQKELRIRDGNVEELNQLSYNEVVELQDQMERSLREIKKRRLEICYKELESVKKTQKQLEMENRELRKHIKAENDSTSAVGRSVIDINFNSGAMCTTAAESSPQLDSDDDLHGELFSDYSDSNASLVELS